MDASPTRVIANPVVIQTLRAVTLRHIAMKANNPAKYRTSKSMDSHVCPQAIPVLATEITDPTAKAPTRTAGTTASTQIMVASTCGTRGLPAGAVGLSSPWLLVTG